MNPLRAFARNKRKTGILALYAIASALVFAIGYHRYADAATRWIPLARGAAACIYLNFALLLLPMARLALSRRGHRYLNLLLPVHKAVEAHQIAGHALVAASVVHVGAYAGLYATNATPLYADLASRPAHLTGIAVAALLGVLWAGALSRGARQFEWFYLSHFLGVPIIALMFVHAPWFLLWMPLPLALYLADRLLRFAWAARGGTAERIVADGRDIDLVVARPPAFTYQAGDYAFLCCPAISPIQWHPFSLVNAPSDSGSLSFRIRRCGGWTERLAALPPGTPIYVDGPFASPCRDMHYADRIIIVAAGIGITPFVSFLAELDRRRAAGRPMPRIALIWLERDEASFSAFYPLVERLARDAGGALRARLVCKRGDGPATLRLVDHEPVAWGPELARLATALGGPTVFCCGPRPLSEAVRVASRAAGLKFRTESF